MKISSRGRYALRLMLDLAINNTGNYIPIKTVAARQEVSEKYLEQIVTPLSKAGFVKSTRGAQGGYKLAYEAGYYTVGAILRMIEGCLAPVACLENEPIECGRAKDCVTLEVWEDLYKAINNVVDNITLSDLVERYHEKQKAII